MAEPENGASWGAGMMTNDKSPMLFVSHHSSKLEVAEHVEKALNAKGVRCWIAPRDVEPGASFARAIPQAIGESNAVLLLFCSNSAKSRHVERELILADQLGKAIIPLRLERIDPGELSYHLAASQWIDWLEKRDEAIDRIAGKARDLQTQGQKEPSKAETILVDPVGDGGPAVDIAKPRPPAATPPGQAASSGPAGGGPLSLDRTGGAPADATDAGRPSGYGGTGAAAGAGAGAGPIGAHDAPPLDPTGGGAGKPSSKLPLFLALGGVGAVLLIGLAYLIISSVMTPSGVTEQWFAGQWSDSRRCNEIYQFEPDGDLITPEGGTGTWSIEGGDTLVIEAQNGERDELRMQRVNDDEVRGDDGSSSYRCD